MIQGACGDCEANVLSVSGQALAGCHGFLAVEPEEAEKALRRRIKRNRLADRVSEVFASTRPIWFGLWVRSPLLQTQCELLQELLEDLSVVDLASLREFLAALRAAVMWELPLHVAFAPPGHVDCGWTTTFPHCPRCKAEADVARWGEVPDDEQVCRVCGGSFSPAATFTQEEWDEEDEVHHDLRQMLGPDIWASFMREWLTERGWKHRDVDEFLDRENFGPLKRRIAELRHRQQQLRAKLASPTSKDSAPTGRSTAQALPEQLVLDVGGVNMVLRLVPAGEFLMGSADDEEHHGESPQHRVCFATPFYMGQCPVTQAEWMTVMGSNNCKFQGDANLPVERVSWLACQEFCLKVSQRVGRIVRLPSEAEWEYACRAGTPSEFFWGDRLTPELANCRTGSWSKVCLDKPTQTTPVATYPPNAWGFYDMHGNVAEWCEDEFDSNYEGAPTDGTPRLTTGAEGVFRVTRGGSHWHYYTACRSAARAMCRVDADEKTADPLGPEVRDESRGFRVVCEVTQLSACNFQRS